MFLSFKYKIMLSMVAAIVVVMTTSLALIRMELSEYFAEAMRSQYERQVAIFQTRQVERLQAVASEISNNTSNPRLLAALLAKDHARFYYDLSQELKGFYQGLVTDSDSSTLRPFFRFIDFNGNYVRPRPSPEVPDMDMLPGISSALDEQSLMRMMQPLHTGAEEALDARSGYLAAAIDGEPVLLHVFVCPVVDAFGEFMGDLIAVIPWSGETEDSEDVIFAILALGEVFSRENLPADIDFEGAVSGARLETDQSDFLVFTSALNSDPRFPPVTQATLFSLRDQEALLELIGTTFLVIALIGVGFSLLLSLGISHGLHAPIQRLRAAVQRVAKGDFNARVQASSNDEIGQLSESFNEMTEELALKERYKAVLSQVADVQVAEQLMRGAVELGGELRQAAVMFCDIRGFTAFSEGLDPQVLISVLNLHMSALTDIVYEHRGVVDKFVGDEIMVLFGVPVSGGNDIRAAFDCAKAIIRKRSELNRDSDFPIKVGIGIAYGPMVAGCIGSLDRLNYTVLGERVNLAARLCSQAGPMEIVIDERIYRELGEGLDAEERSLPLKGFKSSQPFYAIQLQDD